MKNIKRSTTELAVLGILTTSLLVPSAFAFGEQKQNTNNVLNIKNTDIKIETKLDKVESKLQNMLISGIVSEVTTDKGYQFITVGEKLNATTFIVDKSLTVYDHSQNKYSNISEIKKGMNITVVLDKNSPMTMSIPAQTSGAVAIVINDKVGAVNLSVYNTELINEENSLKLNISKDTMINHISGIKKIFTKEDIIGSEAIVLYKIATMSIPAQTNPDFVLILKTADEINSFNGKIEGKDEAVKIDENKKISKYVPLRQACEEKGYEVKWQGVDKPIIITKNDIYIEVKLGSAEFLYTHMTRDIQPLDRLKTIDLIPKLENGKTLISNTFIDMMK